MPRKNRYLIVAVSLLLIIFTAVNITYSVSMQKRDTNIIKIAYMNGFIDAINLDTSKIYDMKKDRDLLREMVIKKAEKYLYVLKKMNE